MWYYRIMRRRWHRLCARYNCCARYRNLCRMSAHRTACISFYYIAGCTRSNKICFYFQLLCFTSCAEFRCAFGPGRRGFVEPAREYGAALESIYNEHNLCHRVYTQTHSCRNATCTNIIENFVLLYSVNAHESRAVACCVVPTRCVYDACSMVHHLNCALYKHLL